MPGGRHTENVNEQFTKEDTPRIGRVQEDESPAAEGHTLRIKAWGLGQRIRVLSDQKWDTATLKRY